MVVQTNETFQYSHEGVKIPIQLILKTWKQSRREATEEILQPEPEHMLLALGPMLRPLDYTKRCKRL